MGDDLDTISMCRSRDAAKSIEELGSLDLPEGRLIYAKMFVKLGNGGRARKLEIKVPNQLIYDRRRAWEPVAKFLERQGFAVKPGQPEGESPEGAA
jgi:hypothetical protein